MAATASRSPGPQIAHQLLVRRYQKHLPLGVAVLGEDPVCDRAHLGLRSGQLDATLQTADHQQRNAHHDRFGNGSRSLMPAVSSTLPAPVFAKREQLGAPAARVSCCLSCTLRAGIEEAYSPASARDASTRSCAR
jgi:hypothetical protein